MEDNDLEPYGSGSEAADEERFQEFLKGCPTFILDFQHVRGLKECFVLLEKAEEEGDPEAQELLEEVIRLGRRLRGFRWQKE